MTLSKFDILGVKFNLINEKEVIELLLNYDYKNKNYICFPSTDTITLAEKNNTLQQILNNSFLTLIDGKFTELIARYKGKNAKVTSAFNILDTLLQSNLSHFFYGLSEEDIIILKAKLKEKYPEARILGFKSPPFLSLNEIKDNISVQSDFEFINSLKPDLIWLGISTPKQDYMAHYNLQNIDQGLFVCIGAVFLYMADLVNPGPSWVKKLGIKWLYRLIQEPKRLWKHTLLTSFDFIKLIIKETFKKKKS
ncbi:MAG: WecB/TagA/CpsF family glycosyltransferase [Bacteroidales bacterium]|nr:WecB/TagA/CpsF family glycosyltransferase [Bacteroidales bacterium]